jgi:hypothetical protein
MLSRVGSGRRLSTSPWTRGPEVVCLDSVSTLGTLDQGAKEGLCWQSVGGLERRAAWRQGDKSIGEDREGGMLYKRRKSRSAVGTCWGWVIV